MEQQIYEEIPQLITVAVTKKGYHTTINFDIERVGDGYTASSVTVITEKPICEDDYGLLVAALVRFKFSADDVEAIQLNYMESKTTEHKNEFNQLKDWRAFSKQKAREVLDYVAGVSGE